MKNAPFGWLAVGALGALANIAIYVPAEMRSRETPGSVIALLVFAGLIGIFLMRWQRLLGGFLVFAGICPNLLLALFIVATLPEGLVMAWVILPPVLMVVAAWNLASTEDSNPSEEIAIVETRLRCGRCGVTYAPFANAWNRAGFCSRKCLLSAR